MVLAVGTNVDALVVYRNLRSVQASISTSMERLSSGLRINKAADDAAGLAISQGLTSSINGIGQAIRNAQDGINMIQTADGALTEVSSMLQRMRTLAVQAANDTNNSTSRNSIQKEITQLKSELTRISESTDFNGLKLLDGSMAAPAPAQAAPAGPSAVVSGAIQVGSGVDLIDSVGTPYWGDGDPSDVTTSMTIDLAVENGAGPGEYALHVTGSDGTDFSIDDFNGPGGGGPFQGVALGLSMNNNVAVQVTFGSGTLTSADVGKTATISVNPQDDGSSGSGLNLQVGANAGDGVAFGIDDMSAAALGVDSVDVSTRDSALTALTTLGDAITAVSETRATLGADQNRLQHTINSLANAQTNLSAANSSILDADMAAEMSALARNQIIQQAGFSMLRQAFQAPSLVLSLLQ